MQIIKKILRRILYLFPSLNIFAHIFFYERPKSLIRLTNVFKTKNEILEDFYKQYAEVKQNKSTLDLGCNDEPSNPFNCSNAYGVDFSADEEKNILKCVIGYEPLPFNDEKFSRITAYDLLEHIPRFNFKSNEISSPFIFAMNEVWRVLEKDGLFLSFTPIYPFQGAYQDPTHNNIITWQTFKQYFSDKKFKIAESYGIKTNFKIEKQYLFGQHLITLMRKV